MRRSESERENGKPPGRGSRRLMSTATVRKSGERRCQFVNVPHHIRPSRGRVAGIIVDFAFSLMVEQKFLNGDGERRGQCMMCVADYVHPEPCWVPSPCHLSWGVCEYKVHL